MTKPVSIIISFYKRIDYLKLVLAGFEKQSFKNFEILIADDGSDEIIVQQVKSLSDKFFFEVKHLWQEDKGFRKNRILNRAIVSASYDFLIFIDGDCIPHHEFVKEHMFYKKELTCNTGRRVNLSEKITMKLTPEKVRSGYLEKKLKLVIDGISGKSSYIEKGFYIRNNYLREYLNKKSRGLIGCNFSINKVDMIKINGFDERYEAPSIGEDSDIQFRLEMNGVKIKSLNNIAVQYHLYHELQERHQKNLELFEEVRKSGLAFTPFGISQQTT